MSRLSVLTLAIVVLASFLVADQFIEIGLEQLGSGDVGRLLLTVIFAALVIERAVEVYINNVFRPKEDLAKFDITRAERSVELAEESLTAEQKRQARSDIQPDAELISDLRNKLAETRSSLLEERMEATPELAKIRREKGVWASTVATLLSLAVAAIGIRILGQFLPLDSSSGELIGPLANTCAELVRTSGVSAVDQLSDSARTACQAVELQLTAFRTVDIILTTLLLAGGADGIHKMLNRFLSYQGNAPSQSN